MTHAQRTILLSPSTALLTGTIDRFIDSVVVGHFHLYSCSRAKPYIRAINVVARNQCINYLRYQIHASTAHELPC